MNLYRYVINGRKKVEKRQRQNMSSYIEMLIKKHMKNCDKNKPQSYCKYQDGKNMYR